jgi:hypothetical protein
MSFIAELWIPIVLSAVLVFVASSLIHMVFKWHNSDYWKLSNEDAVRAVVRAGSPAPGQYVIPHCADMKAMGSPEMQQKFAEGPCAFLTVRASGLPKMGGALGSWFGYVLLLGVIAAYLASHALPHGATALQVCRVVSTVTFVAYCGGSVQSSIWMGKSWSSTSKDILDAVIYAAITGATFGYLWPH